MKNKHHEGYFRQGANYLTGLSGEGKYLTGPGSSGIIQTAGHAITN